MDTSAASRPPFAPSAGETEHTVGLSAMSTRLERAKVVTILNGSGFHIRLGFAKRVFAEIVKRLFDVRVSNVAKDCQSKLLNMRYRRFCDLNLVLVAEFVAYAPNGKHHLRVLRVILDFSPQAIDV